MTTSNQKLSFLSILLIFLVISQAALGQEVYKRIFLIGDAGENQSDQQEVFGRIKNLAGESQKKEIQVNFLILGDNIYPKGLPTISDPDRSAAEVILKSQLDLASFPNSRMWVIPGNHDWEKGRQNGLNAINRQQAFIDSLKLGNVSFLPQDGCAGPIEVPIDSASLMVILDSQWFLHPYEKGGETSDCEFKTPEEVLVALKDIFQKNSDKTILLAMHHPLRTYGEHNGAYGLKQHIFPLTDAKENLYIPLPLIGSIYPIYRTYFGNMQDLAHPVYRKLREDLEKIIFDHPCVVVASGHEHLMEYMQDQQVHFLVSGSGSKSSRLKKNNPMEFASNETGFAVLDFLTDRSIRISFYGQKGEDPIFSKIIPYEEKIKAYEVEDLVEYPDSVFTPISYLYYANRFQRRVLGDNYRDEWQTSVPLRVINLNEESGGLEVLKIGGGMQTKSLRLADQAGKEYVLRSVEKYPELAIPTILRQTIAKDIVQDQISASNPYGSLIVPKLAEATGVYHTSPELVWLPNEPKLKHLRKDFAENVYLFEPREVIPEDLKKKDFDIYSTDKMLQKLQADNDNLVNQESVLKARMLDLWIGDWDRHDDQWRWVGKETEKGREFFPVPRDRDQAFFVNQGFLPRIASRKWIMPKFQGFDYEIRDVEGFMFNGRYFDRSFLNGLSREDWVNTIDELLDLWTKELIDSAVRDLPEEIYSLKGEEIQKKLNYRKTWLKEEALKYYAFLSEEATITGSSKSEIFEINFESEGNVRVTVSKISKKGNLSNVIHNRVYFPEETKELRIYGLGGEDKFSIKGEDSGGPMKIRIIGGLDPDQIIDQSLGNSSSIVYYQWARQDDSLKIKESSKVYRSEEVEVFEYDRKSFKYEVTNPLPSLEYNADDGFYLGAGINWIKQGFRKDPFRIQQSFKANVAVKTGAFNFYYQGHAVDVVKKWDLEWKADLRAPNYVNNFYGFGNESVAPDESFSSDYYWARINMGKAAVLASKSLSPSAVVRIGPVLEYARMDKEDNQGRFVNDEEQSGLNTFDINQEKLYSGLTAQFEVNKVDHNQIPSRGVRFFTEIKHLEGLNPYSRRVTAVSTDLSLYWSFREGSRFTWATRFGGGVNSGNYEFFQSQNLGGKTNLRGYRRFRFSGDAVVYNNTELRIRFVSLKTYLFPASSGIVLFHDIGRVFLEDENSSKWHSGYGFGIWVAPLNRIVILGNLSFGEEGMLPSITFGFQF